MVSLTGNSHPTVTRGSRVSRAPPNHTLPAFLNLNGIFTKSRFEIFQIKFSNFVRAQLSQDLRRKKKRRNQLQRTAILTSTKFTRR